MHRPIWWWNNMQNVFCFVLIFRKKEKNKWLSIWLVKMVNRVPGTNNRYQFQHAFELHGNDYVRLLINKRNKQPKNLHFHAKREQLTCVAEECELKRWWKHEKKRQNSRFTWHDLNWTELHIVTSCFSVGKISSKFRCFYLTHLLVDRDSLRNFFFLNIETHVIIMKRY